MQDGIKWPNWPFDSGLRHFALDQNQNETVFVLIGGGQNVRHQSGERGSAQRHHVEKTKIAKCKLGPWCNVEDIFSATLPKIRSAFCISDFSKAHFAPLIERSQIETVLKNVCFVVQLGGHHRLFDYLIHHKRASHYVVLGEISHSPFTEYIFLEA